MVEICGPPEFSREKLQEEYDRASQLLEEQLRKSNPVTRWIAKRILSSKYRSTISTKIDTVTETGLEILQKL